MIWTILWRRVLPWAAGSPTGRRATAAALRGVADLLDGRRKRANPWKGLVLGAIGGLAGTLAMGGYFTLLGRMTGGQGEESGDEQPSGPLDSIALVGRQYAEGEGSTEALGRLIYQAVAEHPPQSDETRTLMSELVHWSFGASMGALYGLTRGPAATADAEGGLVFGAAVWLLASELTVPLLGLSPGPTAFPLERHLSEFGAHLVYGLTVAATTQVLQRTL